MSSVPHNLTIFRCAASQSKHMVFQRQEKTCSADKYRQGNAMKSLHAQLKAGGSTIALVTASFFSSVAQAQNPASQSVEAVTVTGTSIRGIAPVGSNLITV